MNTTKAEFLFIIGPQRTGTTWLYELFSGQSDGCYIDRIEKENYLFLNESAASDRDLLDFFLNKLSGAGIPQLYIDVCSVYFGHTGVLKKIHRIFPDAKFIYIYRDYASRKISFEGHRKFNRFSLWVIGYTISWKLFEKQSLFYKFEHVLRNTIPKNQLLRLHFDDLKLGAGEIWIDQINDFLKTNVHSCNLGTINKSRKNVPIYILAAFLPYRILQKSRIHIVGKKISMYVSRVLCKF